MLSPSSKSFWIAFPLAVTAVSVFGVSRLRRDAPPVRPLTAPQTPTYVVQDEISTIKPDPQPEQITVPARTALVVRLDRSIATNRVAAGDPFYATVADPVVVDGWNVIPAGAPVRGRILSAREAGRFHGVAELRLALDSVEVHGNAYDLRSSTFARFGHNHKKRNWELIGGGSGGGALIGALAGGAKGLLIGAPIGAVAGLTGDAATAKRNIFIPAESAMTFKLIDPLTVRL